MNYMTKAEVTRSGFKKLADMKSGTWNGMHKLVHKLFHGPDNRDFIYRYNDVDDILLVVSEREPLSDVPHFDTTVKEYDPRPDKGSVFRFSLAFNSVLQRNGRPHDIVKDLDIHTDDTDQFEYGLEKEAALDWINRRPDLGFSLKSEKVLRVDRYREKQLHGHQIPKLSIMKISGTLEVTNSKSFRDSLLNGVGRSKGFGCGLLTIQPTGGNL
jgi:CRISPR system Cascade subunit CasE